MFMVNPSGPLEAILDIRTAHRIHLQVTLKRPGGDAMLLNDSGETSGGPFRVAIPSMEDGDLLRIDLGTLFDEDDDLDLDVALLQDGILLDGSREVLRAHSAAGPARFTLDYMHLQDGMFVARRRDFSQISLEEPVPSAPRFDDGSESGELAPPDDPPAASESGDEGGPPPEPTAVQTERRINVWVTEREGDREEPLARDERYTLCVNVGLPVAGSLAEDAEAVVPDQDIPENGLSTEWVIQSSEAELEPLSDDVAVTRHEAGGVAIWTARFVLHVPRGVDSATVEMACNPLVEGDASLQVLVYARNPARPGRAELYRELEVALSVVMAPTHHDGSAAAPAAAVRVADEVLHSPAGHLNLRTTHEWTSPYNQVSLTVLSTGMVLVQGDLGTRELDEEVPWQVAPEEVRGLIANVRAALERFRAKHDGYLNAISVDDLERRLPSTSEAAYTSFFGTGEPPSAESLATWETVSRSPELYDLAVEGRTLYDAFFPQGSELRSWIDDMQPHDRLDLNLQPRAGAAYVPHVPWGLIYRLEPPLFGEGAVDPMGFLGLALRLGYSAHKNPVPSKALGRVESVNRAFFLYWGDQPNDPTAAEAKWQRDRWAGQPNHLIVSNDGDAGQRKRRLLNLLHAPEPSPVRLLYFYCQCKAEQGNRPELRFANNTHPDNLVRHTELGTALLQERPLVFANACTTAAADISMLNELEARFFRRGARAYIGTESKVPIALASRFAHVFFHYFERRASERPIAAGEAVYQARMFLWRHYRNLGGLFYTYVNQFELYMADDAEVRSLQP